jgi:hypothetical protein
MHDGHFAVPDIVFSIADGALTRVAPSNELAINQIHGSNNRLSKAPAGSHEISHPVLLHQN